MNARTIFSVVGCFCLVLCCYFTHVVLMFNFAFHPPPQVHMFDARHSTVRFGVKSTISFDCYRIQFLKTRAMENHVGVNDDDGAGGGGQVKLARPVCSTKQMNGTTVRSCISVTDSSSGGGGGGGGGGSSVGGGSQMHVADVLLFTAAGDAAPASYRPEVETTSGAAAATRSYYGYYGTVTAAFLYGGLLRWI